jgi:hypothetical protein
MARAKRALDKDPHLRSSPILGEGKKNLGFIAAAALNDSRERTPGIWTLTRRAKTRVGLSLTERGKRRDSSPSAALMASGGRSII